MSDDVLARLRDAARVSGPSRRQARRRQALLGLAAPLLAVALFVPAGAYEKSWTIPAETGVVGIEPAQLDPAWWVARQAQPDRVILDAPAIQA